MTDQTHYDRFSLPCDIPDAAPDVHPLTGETKEEKLQRVLAEHGLRLKEPGEGWDDDEGREAHPAADDLLGPQAPGGDDPLFGPQTPGGAHPRPLASSQKLGRAFALASPSARDTSPDSELRAEGAGTTFGSTEALTPQRMADFLVSMQTLGNVSIACKRAGIARQTAYRARRRHAGFARAWDAALVAARTVAESELAERAIHGVEEKVFYHGEEVATRRRYDARLLLAHLARLDRAAERLDVAAALPELDGWIAALREGGDVDAVLPVQVDRAALLEAQEERDWIADPRAEQEREVEAERASVLRKRSCDAVTPAQDERGVGAGATAASGDRENSSQDTVTPVTPCPDNPCPDCGGFCLDAEEDAAVRLTQADCMWSGNRLDRMHAARPVDAPTPKALAAGDFERQCAIEMLQLEAFEAGVEEWWLVSDAEGPED